MMQEPISLEGASVLVTGADGFIGSHLVERLLAEKARVRALCYYTSESSIGWLRDLDPSARSSVDVRLGDVRDPRFVEEIADGVDVIFHLAALVSIPYSYEAPRSVMDTNALGTMNVLEAARRSDARVVHTSTSEVYGTPEETPIRETHPLRAQSPYSASKVAADKLCEAYALSFGTRVTILRPFNTFGPRQSLRAVIPTILSPLLARRETIRLGNLHPRRDFTFVTDTVDGFVRAGETELESGTVVQLGTGRSVSVANLVEMCSEVTGRRADVIEEARRTRPARSEVDELISDPTFAKEILGWEARVSLEEGLERTAQWLQARAPNEDVDAYHR